MAVAQKQRNSLSAVIFPNKISTEQQSLVLVKRLLAIAVSCITYLRGIFPECAYGTRYLDDLCVKILKEDKNCPSSGQLVKWMLGCYDALQKKYLRLIVLAVYTNQDDPQTVTECYQFKFKYTDKGPSMDFVSKHQGDNYNITCADTKKASILLLRKIYVLMQNLGPLPDDVCLTMKLFYYDEVTPPDYQPPGFKEGDSEEMVFEGEPVYLNVGEIPTPFHMLKVKVTTEKDRMEHIDRAILKPGNLLMPTKAQHFDEGQDQKMDEDFITENKMREEKNAKEALHVRELNLTCEEDENMKIEESQNLSINSSQHERRRTCLETFKSLVHLCVNLTAELEKLGSTCEWKKKRQRVDHLVNNTSKLEVSESKTRSGKLFQCNEGGREKSENQLAAKFPKETQKRHSLGSGKPVYNFEFSSSQDLGPKRRRFSEPKEQF